MKSAHLPPVRVAPAIRQEIESCLRDGESLSQFVEQAVVNAARARLADDAFLARGRASLAKALKTGKTYPAGETLEAMRARLATRMNDLKKQSRMKP